MDVVLPLVTFVAAIIGVVLGGWMARRNDKSATSERLLTEALNDALAAVAALANGADMPARAEYASALARIALHGPPQVISAFCALQDIGTTATADGRRRLLNALIVARRELDQAAADEAELAVLMFGPGGVR